MRYALLTLAVLMFCACGGGGGSSPASSNSTSGNATTNQPPSNQQNVDLTAACSTIDACANYCTMYDFYLTPSQIASLNSQYGLSASSDSIFAYSNSLNAAKYQTCMSSKASVVLPSTDISAIHCGDNSVCESKCRSRFAFQDPSALIASYVANGGSQTSQAVSAYYLNFLMEMSYQACINSPASEVN